MTNTAKKQQAKKTFYSLTGLGISIEATSHAEALEKAKKKYPAKFGLEPKEEKKKEGKEKELRDSDKKSN